jgi:hypothetical protein
LNADATSVRAVTLLIPVSPFYFWSTDTTVLI